MRALRASINATIVADFGKTDISNGSLYLVALKTAETLLVIRELAKQFKQKRAGEKERVISGVYWEEALEYRYQKQGRSWAVQISGPFAFELDEDTALDGVDVDDEEIADLLIAYRESGDSPIVVPASVRVISAALSETEEDEEFEQF